MAELGKKLGKLSLAILENFVQKALGEKFVGELRQPTDREAAIESALEKAEDRFYREFKDRTFAEKMFTQVNDDNLGLLVTAIEKYYDHPTNPDLPRTLNQIVAESFPDSDAGLVKSAVEMYVSILTEEFMIADEKFREKFRGLADVRSLEVLRRVEALLSQRETPKIENTIFRSIHQLPQSPADFIGREELIEQLLSDFNSHKDPTISGLTGMGGIGKTVLGLKVAHMVAESYPDAQIFLDLKGTTTPLSALDIARHVILSFEPTADLRALDETNMQAAYQSVLHGKKALLFFDNARSANQIAPLRPPDTCAMLVTSRWTFAVAGLQSRRVDVMGEKDAKEFLLELCLGIGDKAAELAKACVYLPLALRIAGSFLQVNSEWSIEKYLSQLNDRKKRLEALKQSREDAELTMEPDLIATFELSYNQLSEESRKHWRMLGVFSASFLWTAASSVWGPLEEDTTNRLLNLLKRYNLVEFDMTNSRFYLHDLLADYALAQMSYEEEQDARIRHGFYCINILELASKLLLSGGENTYQGLRLFDLEWEEIRSGQKWAEGAKDKNKIFLEFCFDYSNVGNAILDWRQHPRERIHWLELALLTARRLKDIRREVWALGNLGGVYLKLGDAKKSIEYSERALEIDRKLNDRHGESTDLGNLGRAFAVLGDIHKASEFFYQELEVATELGNPRGISSALNELGNIYMNSGELSKATDFFEKALLIYRGLGNMLGESTVLGNLGATYSLRGNLHKAIEISKQALNISHELGNRQNEAANLGNLAITYVKLGNVDKAIEYYHKVLLVHRELGDRHGESADLGNLGVAYGELNELHKAMEYYEGALLIKREIGDIFGEATVLGNLGNTYYELGNKNRAIELTKQALSIFEEIESPYVKQARETLKEWGVDE